MGISGIFLNTREVYMKYKVIYADPPWAYKDKRTGNKSDKSGRICGGAEVYYDTLEIQEIKDLPIKDIADDDCLLFLWATFPNLREALDTIDAWGFTYKTIGFTWVKTNKKSSSSFFGIGAYTRSNSEICLLGTRGKPVIKDHGISSIVESTIKSPIEKHSSKPACIRDLIERLSDGPRIELFARQKTENWTSVGYEIDGKDIRDVLKGL